MRKLFLLVTILLIASFGALAQDGTAQILDKKGKVVAQIKLENGQFTYKDVVYQCEKKKYSDFCIDDPIDNNPEEGIFIHLEKGKPVSGYENHCGARPQFRRFEIFVLKK